MNDKKAAALAIIRQRALNIPHWELYDVETYLELAYLGYSYDPARKVWEIRPDFSPPPRPAVSLEPADVEVLLTDSVRRLSLLLQHGATHQGKDTQMRIILKRLHAIYFTLYGAKHETTN